MAASRRTRAALLLGATLTLVLGLQLAAGPAFAGPASDANAGEAWKGNSGVVKVDDIPFDDHPNNEPHVGCDFQIDLTGFAAGHAPVTVTFTAHHPTQADGEDQVLLEDELTLVPGAHGLGASRAYTLRLDGITPHDKQGVHVKLTVDTGRGAGKHKVFWVKDCGPPPPSTSTADDTPTTHGDKGKEGEESEEEDEADGSSTTGSTESEDQGPPGTTAPPTTTVPVPAANGQPPGGGSLPFTGAAAVPLLMIGTVLLLGGVLMLRAGRVRTARAQAHGDRPPAPPA